MEAPHRVLGCAGWVKEVYAEGGGSMSQPAPRGTIALLAFAETLPKRAENLRGFFDYNAAAADIMRCKEIIERLAQYEPDIEVEPGEN